MKCPNCGKEMRNGYLFCSKDGAFSFANEVPVFLKMQRTQTDLSKLQNSSRVTERKSKHPSVRNAGRLFLIIKN